MPVQVALHDQKSHVALHFKYFDLRNEIVPLMMPSVACDVPLDHMVSCDQRVMLHLILIVLI